MIRVVRRRCDRPGYPLRSTCRCFLGRRVYSPPPPAAAWHTRLFPSRGTLKWAAPGRAPISSFNGFCSASRERWTTDEIAENNGREVNRRTVAPRSRASCMHLPYARSIPLSGALLFPGHFFFPCTKNRRTGHDMCTVCNPSHTNHARQDLIRDWKEIINPKD
jgi:hypothetical protein